MSRPFKSHEELFYAARQLEPFLKVWAKDPKRRRLDDIFWHEVPHFKNEQARTFGDLMDGLQKIAKKYSCSIPPASESSRSIQIRGRDAYAMAMKMMVEGLTPLMTLKRVGQIVPVMKDIVAMIDTWAEFKHEEYGSKENFSNEFIRYAMASFISTGLNIDSFDKERAKRQAQKAEAPMKNAYAGVQGGFGNQILSYAVIVAGDDHGIAQAKKIPGAVIEI